MLLTVLKLKKKIATDDMRPTIYYETKPKHSRTGYQNLITPVTKYGFFPLKLNHMDVYLFFSESLSTSLGGQMRKDQIKTGILELIAERK